MPPTDDYLNLANPVRSTLSNLVSQEGWSLVETSSITGELLSEDVRVIVFFEPPQDVIDLSISNPGIQLLAIGVAGLEPSANLSLIGSMGFRIDRQAFLAGYLSAMLTDDWRVG